MAEFSTTSVRLQAGKDCDWQGEPVALLMWNVLDILV
jgi:hypothetical protein